MDHDNLIARITAGIAAIPGLDGLFLGGSHGRGTADMWSDIDIVGVAVAADQPAIAQAWHDCLAAIAPLVLHQTRNFAQSTLVNAITDDWTRVDLYLVEMPDFSLRGAATVRPLSDPQGLHGALPADPPAALIAKIVPLTVEFLRVLGLLQVAIGRGEYVLGTVGAGLLRDHMIALMRIAAGTHDSHGALHLRRSITPADLALLEALPLVAPDRASVIAAHDRLARLFLPRARKLHAGIAAAWPQAFEVATMVALARHLGPDWSLTPDQSN